MAKLRSRNSTGGALVMSVAGIFAVSFFALIFTMLIINTGLASFYSNKVNFIADQAAQYAAGELSWDCSRNTHVSLAQVNQDVTRLVNCLLSNSGLPAASQVDVQDSGSSISVSFNVNGLALASGNGSLFPSVISMSAGAAKDLSEDEPHGLMNVSAQGGGSSVLIPVYGRYPFYFVSPINPDLPGAAGLRNFLRPVEGQSYSGMPGTFSQTLR